MTFNNPKLSVGILAVILFAGVATESVRIANNRSYTNDDNVVVAQEIQTQESIEVCQAETEVKTYNYVSSVDTKKQKETQIEKETKKVTQKAAKKTKKKTEKQTEAPTEAVTEAVAQPVISLSDEDYNNLVRIVEAEVSNCDDFSKICVANVIINRVKSTRFPNTVTEVVYQGNGQQFSPIADGRFYSVAITQSTIDAVNRALYGEDCSQGALYFASTASVNRGNWHSRNLKKLFEHSGVVYFTLW